MKNQHEVRATDSLVVTTGNPCREDETRTSDANFASYTEAPERHTIPRRLTKIVSNLCTSLAD